VIVLQGFEYHIDVVFCVDVTADMAPVLDHIKETVCRSPQILKGKLAAKGKIVNSLRVRVIAFRDFANDPDPMRASDFIEVEPNADLAGLESFINSLSAFGGGDEPESGLEALATAIMSDWTHKGDKQGHIIVMFTSASAHKLESRIGELPTEFKDLIPGSFDELTDRWNGDQSVRLIRSARRLLIVGPDAYPWNVINDAWGNTVWFPVPGGFISGDDVGEILANSI